MKTILSSDLPRTPNSTTLVNISSKKSYLQSVLDKASSMGYAPTSNISAYSDLVNALEKEGILAKLDLLYVLNGDGDTNFKLLNIADTSQYDGIAKGGLNWDNDGVSGNGKDGYIDTSLYPGMYGNLSKFALTSASGGLIIKSSDNSSTEILSSYNFCIQEDGKNSKVCSQTADFSSTVSKNKTGLRVNVRSDSAILLTAKDAYENPKPTLNPNLGLYKFLILHGASSILYSTAKISLAFIGASLTYDETQKIRELFNNYLTDIGQLAYA